MIMIAGVAVCVIVCAGTGVFVAIEKIKSGEEYHPYA